jgi:hypothetical protein
MEHDVGLWKRTDTLLAMSENGTGSRAGGRRGNTTYVRRLRNKPDRPSLFFFFNIITIRLERPHPSLVVLNLSPIIHPIALHFVITFYGHSNPSINTLIRPSLTPYSLSLFRFIQYLHIDPEFKI